MFTVTANTRPARPEDANAISQVHAQSWRQAYTGILPYKALMKMINRRDAKWWARAIRKSTIVMVAEMDGEIAGYVTLGPNRVSTFPFEGEIYELYLKPEFQGIGLGAMLFAQARKELKRRAYKGVTVWVLQDNESAVGFYQNAGGRPIARGSEHFDDTKLEKIAIAWD